MQMTLFDLPTPAPKNPGGRPKWDKAKENQELVETLCEWGFDQSQIAEAANVSIPTLRLNYSRILSWRERWGDLRQEGGER